MKSYLLRASKLEEHTNIERKVDVGFSEFEGGHENIIRERGSANDW